MHDFDLDQFENTAAWLEYCDGMTRFEAETEAARRQGVKRYDAIRVGHSQGQQHPSEAPARNAANNLPRVQSAPQEQKGSVLIGDVQAGRGSMDVLALPVVGGPVL